MWALDMLLQKIPYKCFTKCLQVETAVAEVFQDSPVGEVAEPHDIRWYCSNICVVIENHHWPSVAIQLHWISTSKIISAALASFVINILGKYYWFLLITLNRFVMMHRESKMTALFLLDIYKMRVSWPTNIKIQDCFYLSRLCCISAGMSVRYPRLFQRTCKSGVGPEDPLPVKHLWKICQHSYCLPVLPYHGSTKSFTSWVPWLY